MQVVKKHRNISFCLKYHQILYPYFVYFVLLSIAIPLLTVYPQSLVLRPFVHHRRNLGTTHLLRYADIYPENGQKKSIPTTEMLFYHLYTYFSQLSTTSNRSAAVSNYYSFCFVFRLLDAHFRFNSIDVCNCQEFMIHCCNLSRVIASHDSNCQRNEVLTV
jgi:hypothetical protein